MATLLGPIRIRFITGILFGVIVLQVASGTTAQARTSTAGNPNATTQADVDAVATATGPPIGFFVHKPLCGCMREKKPTGVG